GSPAARGARASGSCWSGCSGVRSADGRRTSLRRCSATCASCGPTSSDAAACCSTIPAIPRRRSTSTRTATTCRTTGGACIPSGSPSASACSCRDLPQLRLRRLFCRGRRDLLAPAAARPERAPARVELFLLRLRPPVVPAPDRLVDDDRLSVGARDGAVAGAQVAVHGAEHRLELRDAQLLQVCQLLFPQRAGRAGRPRLPPERARASRGPSRRHLLLHLPGDELPRP